MKPVDWPIKETGREKSANKMLKIAVETLSRIKVTKVNCAFIVPIGSDIFF